MTAPVEAQRRAKALGELYERWLADHPGSPDDPDDDPVFADAGRLIMGLPPLED